MTPARIAFVLTLLLAFGANAAEDAVLREAKSLMDARQPQQAYDLLKPLEEEEAGNPDYDFLLGIAATDIGRNTEAIFALQRVVDQDPNHGPARAELARALMQANETDAARRELEILQEQDPPSDVKRVLEEYLAAIDRYHGAYRTTFARYVQTGMGFDTNVNNATDRGAVAVPGLGGLVFALTPDSRELDSTIWNLGAGFSFSAPLRDALRLVGGIDFDYDIALKDSDFTTPAVERLRRQDHAAEGEAACIELGLEGVDYREQTVEADIFTGVFVENALRFVRVDRIFAADLETAHDETHDRNFLCRGPDSDGPAYAGHQYTFENRPHPPATVADVYDFLLSL